MSRMEEWRILSVLVFGVWTGISRAVQGVGTQGMETAMGSLYVLVPVWRIGYPCIRGEKTFDQTSGHFVVVRVEDSHHSVLE